MEQPPPAPAAASETSAPPATSLLAKLFNIFAVPGDVFSEIKAARATVAAHWFVPVLIASLLGIASAFIMFSQPNIQQQLREQQAKVFEKQVKAGKMTQAQADQAAAASEKFMGPTVMKIVGSIGAVVVSFIRVFWWAFILWLLGRWFLKTTVDYSKTLEVAGLAVMIAALGTVVAILIQMNMDQLMAGPSLGLLVTEFDMSRKSHWFLAVANPFYFWQVGIMALGLAKLAGASFLKAAVPVIVFWLLQESGLILIGLGQFAL